tara:strand:- start:100 stop:276 length:177 start_codon:yes stop_codon:yes gene_type:complete
LAPSIYLFLFIFIYLKNFAPLRGALRVAPRLASLGSVGELLSIVGTISSQEFESLFFF